MLGGFHLRNRWRSKHSVGLLPATLKSNILRIIASDKRAPPIKPPVKISGSCLLFPNHLILHIHTHKPPINVNHTRAPNTNHAHQIPPLPPSPPTRPFLNRPRQQPPRHRRRPQNRHRPPSPNGPKQRKTQQRSTTPARCPRTWPSRPKFPSPTRST